MADVDPLINKLISQIYDTALEPALWPELLEKLVDALPLTQQKLTGAEQAIASPYLLDQHPTMQILLAHLQRSVVMSEQLKLNDEKYHLERTLFEQLPLPMLILSPSGQLLQKNQHATKFLNSDDLVLIRDKKLCLDNNLLQRQFEKILSKLTQASQQNAEYSMRLRDNYRSAPVSINLSRISDQYQLKGNILLLVASYDPKQLPDLATIAKHFSLTPAEVRLLEKLISTKTLHQIASLHQVSIHTVRSQLKSIFRKTECRRQSELIKLIMNSPALPSANISQPLLAQYQLNAPCYHKTITLRDGRQLGYADLGARSGLPVIMLHPSTGSRLQQHPDESILFASKIRLITPDRPGFGLSDPTPNLSLLSYADDLRELADQLKLQKFVLAGYCGGAPYALACASRLAARVLHTILISPVSPYQAINLFHGVKSSNKLLAKLALNFPSALQPLLNLMARSLLIEPERYFDQVYQHLCEGDAAALSEPEVTDNILLALREAMRQGTAAFSNDLLLLSQEWGIDFKAISQPISIWHGSLDRHVPINLVRQLQGALGNATLHEIEGQGHLLIYYRWREILQSVKAHQGECGSE